MTALRIAFVIDSLESGGAQRQAVALARELVRRREIEARFLVYRDADFFAAPLREAGIAVDRLHKSFTIDPLFPGRMRGWLRTHRIEVVHALLEAPSFWSVLALRALPRDERPPLLCAERSGRIAASPALHLLQRFIYRRADLVTVNASSVAGEIETRCGVPRERIRYIPNGIDLSDWDRTLALDSPVALEPQRFHVALVGRIVPQKDHALLLDALGRIGREKLSDWRIWCIGEPADRAFLASLQSDAAQRGLSDVLRFLPPQPNIGAFLTRLDLLVLPSRWEGFPNVVLEAMASELCVVASEVGDVAKLVDPETSGLLIRPGDAAQLADALLRVHALGREARRAMGRAGRRIVEQRFQISSIADAHLELYRALLAGQ